MRFVPLLPSNIDPEPWVDLGPLALRWQGEPSAWAARVRRGVVLSAVFLPGQELLAEALEVLQACLDPDFLILPVAAPQNREAGFRLLGQLEALLEATSGRGTKLALQLAPGSEPALLGLLQQAHGEAVGFCWQPGNQDPEPLADRLWFGLGEPGVDLRPLQRLGYRWDLALPAVDPADFLRQAAAFQAAFPPVLFPAELPAKALGRPVVADASVTFGRAWGPLEEAP